MRLIGRNHKPPGSPHHTPKVPHCETDRQKATAPDVRQTLPRAKRGRQVRSSFLTVGNLLAGLARVRGRGLAAFLGVREVLTADLRH